MFPSLTGVIRFLINAMVALDEIIKVSVPYRGYSFFNRKNYEKRKNNKHKSFRPLQGLFVF